MNSQKRWAVEIFFHYPPINHYLTVEGVRAANEEEAINIFKKVHFTPCRYEIIGVYPWGSEQHKKLARKYGHFTVIPTNC